MSAGTVDLDDNIIVEFGTVPDAFFLAYGSRWHANLIPPLLLNLAFSPTSADRIKRFVSVALAPTGGFFACYETHDCVFRGVASALDNYPTLLTFLKTHLDPRTKNAAHLVLTSPILVRFGPLGGSFYAKNITTGEFRCSGIPEPMRTKETPKFISFGLGDKNPQTGKIPPSMVIVTDKTVKAMHLPSKVAEFFKEDGRRWKEVKNLCVANHPSNIGKYFVMSDVAVDKATFASKLSVCLGMLPLLKSFLVERNNWYLEVAGMPVTQEIPAVDLPVPTPLVVSQPIIQQPQPVPAGGTVAVSAVNDAIGDALVAAANTVGPTMTQIGKGMAKQAKKALKSDLTKKLLIGTSTVLVGQEVTDMFRTDQTRGRGRGRGRGARGRGRGRGRGGAGGNMGILPAVLTGMTGVPMARGGGARGRGRGAVRGAGAARGGARGGMAGQNNALLQQQRLKQQQMLQQQRMQQQRLQMQQQRLQQQQMMQAQQQQQMAMAGGMGAGMDASGQYYDDENGYYDENGDYYGYGDDDYYDENEDYYGDDVDGDYGDEDYYDDDEPPPAYDYDGGDFDSGVDYGGGGDFDSGGYDGGDC